MNNNKIPFIVESALNSSYIDSLFVSMFFKQSYVQDILSEYPQNISFIYLQELIFENFVCNMRRNYFIDSTIINEIRNYMILCGWKTGSDAINIYDVQELYSFLINGFNKGKLSLNVRDQIKTLDYIELKITKNTNIKTLLDDYFDEFLMEYKFNDVPNFIPIYLNRNYETGNAKLNNFAVDIKHGICISKNNVDEGQKNLLWTIHSIVCYSGGHYYSIVTDGTNWYLFSNFKLPSLLKIDIKDEDLAAKIKQECVFIIYVN
jgi:hypothetical protein